MLSWPFFCLILISSRFSHWGWHNFFFFFSWPYCGMYTWCTSAVSKLWYNLLDLWELTEYIQNIANMYGSSSIFLYIIDDKIWADQTKSPWTQKRHPMKDVNLDDAHLDTIRCSFDICPCLVAKCFSKS